MWLQSVVVSVGLGAGCMPVLPERSTRPGAGHTSFVAAPRSLF